MRGSERGGWQSAALRRQWGRRGGGRGLLTREEEERAQERGARFARGTSRAERREGGRRGSQGKIGAVGGVILCESVIVPSNKRLLLIGLQYESRVRRVSGVRISTCEPAGARSIARCSARSAQAERRTPDNQTRGASSRGRALTTRRSTTITYHSTHRIHPLRPSPFSLSLCPSVSCGVLSLVERKSFNPASLGHPTPSCALSRPPSPTPQPPPSLSSTKHV